MDQQNLQENNQHETTNDTQNNSNQNNGVGIPSTPQAFGNYSLAPKETEEQKQYRITQKFNDWVYYFTTKSEKDTYGNRTASAIKAYNLDPKTQRGSAMSMGSQNYRKLKGLASQIGEEEGFTYDKMILFGLSKMTTTDNEAVAKQWWDELMVLMDYKDPPGAQVIINNDNRSVNVDINAPETQDFNRKFEKFLETL